MSDTSRVFILGAGFSKPAGMPLATEILPFITPNLELDEMQEWLEGLGERIAWLSTIDTPQASPTLNIEQVFHYAHFDVELQRLLQHLAPVGRHDGPCTAWNFSEKIDAWLSYLEEDLQDLISTKEDQCCMDPIDRWAKHMSHGDSVLSFNYDTLVERALTKQSTGWNHGVGRKSDSEISVFKLHGSIDWIVAHRKESLRGCDLLFDKPNHNRSDTNTSHVEDDYRLWRCQSQEQRQRWIANRDVQLTIEGALPNSVGIAGLGAYKQLHQIPGLGQVWAGGLRALNCADKCIIVGFSLSDFDAMAQMQFGDVARKRQIEGRPLHVMVIDPYLSDASKVRFRRVFRHIEFVPAPHESFDWSGL